MNVSSVTVKIAGIESTANTTSLDSIATSAASSGVASDCRCDGRRTAAPRSARVTGITCRSGTYEEVAVRVAHFALPPGQLARR